MAIPKARPGLGSISFGLALCLLVDMQADVAEILVSIDARHFIDDRARARSRPRSSQKHLIDADVVFTHAPSRETFLEPPAYFASVKLQHLRQGCDRFLEGSHHVTGDALVDDLSNRAIVVSENGSAARHGFNHD